MDNQLTELVLAVEFVPNTPPDVINWIKHLIDPDDKALPSPIARPDFPLWSEPVSAAPAYLDIFHGSHTAFPGTHCVHFELQAASQTYHLTLRSVVRNYRREVESFLLWLMPYVIPHGASGTYRALSDPLPSIITYPERGKLVVIDRLDSMIEKLNGQIEDLFGERKISERQDVRVSERRKNQNATE